MGEIKFVKKSTFIITIILLLLLFAISIFGIIYYYENRNNDINIPKEIDNEININDFSFEIVGEGN